MSGSNPSRGDSAPRAAALTRFAPAPTGLLHLGHVLNALYVWSTARVLEARVLLRVEDHDRQRSRPEFESALLDDLDWLGFVPDLYPTGAFRAGRCAGRQSDREAVYREALAALVAQGRVYACDCSRRTLGTTVAGAERPYPGTCRTRRLPLESGHGLRVIVDDAVEIFEDLLLGSQAQNPARTSGDILVRDRRGNWTYQFAVAVDDHRQEVDLVIRGVDLLGSTGRQIHLSRLLGRTVPPLFMHHPLILKSPGRKLSKSDRDTGVRDLRAAGWTRERVLGEAAKHMPVTPERLFAPQNRSRMTRRPVPESG